MPDEEEAYSTAAMRRLLTVAFDDPGLDAFAMDSYPEVYDRFSRGLRKDEKTTLLLDHCRRTEGELERLSAAVQARVPWTYLPPRPPDPAELAEPGSRLPGWRLPFLRNALFTGRIGPLKALAQVLLHTPTGSLSSPVAQVVHAMGGAGKTQLAVEFTYRYGRFFHGVHWLNAVQPSSLEAQVAECGLAMGLPNWPDRQPEQVARTLGAWSESGPRLIVLDNIEDVPVARDWLARLAAGGTMRLLLTSRRRSWPADLGLIPLPLELFSPAESLAFLRRYLPTAADQDLHALAERLGHLPLALELAGRYLADLPRLPVAGYTARMRDALGDPSMNNWLAELGNPTGHDLDLAATFALSWQRVTGPEGPAARRLFAIAGWCAPNQPIPCQVLEQAAGLDVESCDQAAGLLARLGLVDWENRLAGPALHPLLAEFGRKLEADGAPLVALVNALMEIAYQANDTGLPAQFVPLRPHIEAAVAWADEVGLETAGVLWNELGSHRHKVADYAGARAAYERALAIFQRALGSDDPNVTALVNNLGLVLQDMGDLAGARAAFEQALRIDEQAYGPDHPAIAADVNNLGSALKVLGDLAGARAAFERALRIDEQAKGPDHPDVATDVNNLGSVLHDLGDLAGARAAFERALRIGEHSYGPDHPAIAPDINNLGRLLHDLGDLAGARAAFERALRIDEQVYGLDHPDVARDVNNLGGVLQALGDLAGAQAAFERALAIDERACGPGHPDVARDVNNLGGVLQALGDLAGTRAAYERALAIWQSAYGQEHIQVAIAHNNLGLVLPAFGDLAGARAEFEQALAILVKLLPPDHPLIQIARRNLSEANALT